MAKKVKPQAKQKAQAELKDKADRVLAKVPEGYVFWCHDGRTFRQMEDLAKGLAAMSDDIFAYHVSSDRNDFSKWVKDVIRDEELASDLAVVTSRTQAAECVAVRLAVLTRARQNERAGT